MLRRNFLFLQAIVLLLGQLAGCVTGPREAAFGDLRLQGKLGVVQGGRAFSTNFSWVQQGEQLDIALWGPLGQGRTRLRGTVRRLDLLAADGGVLASGHPEALMAEHLGWSLPLGLYLDWMAGRPSPTAAVTEPVSDEDGRLTSFRQLGWTVAYDRFKQFPAGLLPWRITAEQPGRRVRIALTEHRR